MKLAESNKIITLENKTDILQHEYENFPHKTNKNEQTTNDDFLAQYGYINNR